MRNCYGNKNDQKKYNQEPFYEMKGNDGEQMNKSFVLWELSQYGISPLKYTILEQSKRERNRIVWKVETDKGNYALKQIELNKAKKIAAIKGILGKKKNTNYPCYPDINRSLCDRERGFRTCSFSMD